MTKPEGICLGVNEHYDTTKDVYLPENLRSRHLYIVGASGSGKSTLLTNVIKQDLEAGAGFAVVDPHGDLVEDVLARVPSERTGDVIYFNPADREYITPLSILAARSPEEQILVADALIVAFRRLVESWGEAAQASGMAERVLAAFAPTTCMIISFIMRDLPSAPHGPPPPLSPRKQRVFRIGPEPSRARSGEANP